MAAPARSARDTRGPSSFRLLALSLALFAGVIGFFVGRFVGNSVAEGFRFDWYVHSGVASAPAARVGIVSALLAASLAATVAPLAMAVLYRLWDRKGYRVRRQPGASSRDGHAIVLSLALALVLALFLGASAAGGLIALGADPVSPEGYALLVAATATIAAALSTYFAIARTADGLRDGRIAKSQEGENFFAKIALTSHRHPKGTIAAIAAVTLVLGYGLTLIDTNVDVADVMPRGDPNTAAAKNLTTKFKSTFTQQVTFQFHVAPEGQWERDNDKFLPYRQTPNAPGNISDEVYVRAIDQFNDFVKNYPDSPFTGSVSIPDFFRLINWTAAGGIRADPESFSLPPTTPNGESQYAVVNRSTFAAVYGTVDAVASPSWRQTATVINVDPTIALDSKTIGLKALEIRDAYVAWAKEEPDAYKVFTGENAPKFSVDLPIANAHSSELAGKDFGKLLPIISVWILVCIFVAFRSIRAILIAFTTLAVSVVWTFGAMGWRDIPLNTLNLTVIPLIMGVGIDYGIHLVNTYQEQRGAGKSNEEAFRIVGGRGGLALFIATLNTVTGLMVMFVSPSLLIAELGFLASFAITSSYILAITLIPAFLTLAGDNAKAREYRPSHVMAAIARFVSRTRVVAVVLIVLASGAAYAATSALTKEEFGDPPRNWLPEDPLRQEHETALKGFYDSETDDVKANVLIFEGDIADPRAHKYMDAIEASLKKQPRVVSDTLRTLPFLIRTYLTVRDGAPGAGEFLLSDALAKRFNQPQADPYPTTRAEIEGLLNEVPKTPLRGFGNLFYDYPQNDMAIMLFSARAASYEDAAEVWNQVQAAIQENEALRPPGMHVSFFGNTAINYLFIAKELPWLGYMSVVSNVLVLAFVFIPTGKWRPTLVVGLLNFLTGLWWLAILPFFGIGLAITLTLPLVFIFAVGSDYGLHLVLHMEEGHDPEETFRTTGKAILFSAITILGAFLIYTQMSNLAVRRTMVATAIAIPIIFLVTMLVVPILYPIRREKGGEPETRRVEVKSVGDARAPVPVNSP